MVSLLQRRWGKSAGRMQLLEVIFLRFYSSYSVCALRTAWKIFLFQSWSCTARLTVAWNAEGTNADLLISVFCMSFCWEECNLWGSSMATAVILSKWPKWPAQREFPEPDAMSFSCKVLWILTMQGSCCSVPGNDLESLDCPKNPLQDINLLKTIYGMDLDAADEGRLLRFQQDWCL